MAPWNRQEKRCCLAVLVSPEEAKRSAVIRFRQGFGRLIRSKSDRGVVVVTDPRIVTKNYGAVFRKSIPASVRTVAEASQLMSMVADFFEEDAT